MEKMNQMGSAEQLAPASDKTRQQQRAADPRGTAQQAGGEAAAPQMGTVQFRDWASI